MSQRNCAQQTCLHINKENALGKTPLAAALVYLDPIPACPNKNKQKENSATLCHAKITLTLSQAIRKVPTTTSVSQTLPLATTNPCETVPNRQRCFYERSSIQRVSKSPCVSPRCRGGTAPTGTRSSPRTDGGGQPARQGLYWEARRPNANITVTEPKQPRPDSAQELASRFARSGTQPSTELLNPLPKVALRR